MQYDVSHVYFIIFSASIYEASATFLYEHSFKFIFFSSSYFCNMRQQMFSMPHLIFDISYTKKDTWKKCKRTRGKKNNRQKNFFSTKVSYFVLHFALKCFFKHTIFMVLLKALILHKHLPERVWCPDYISRFIIHCQCTDDKITMVK